ncbi:CRISPR-associated ring nuclease Csm6 [Rhodocaloribacter sp.]
MPSSQLRRYHLVIVMGASPAVLTETVWSLARQHHPPLHPAAIDVITTGVGRAIVEARLFGLARRHPVEGTLLDAEDRWGRFCETVLEGRRPPVRFHVPTRSDGTPLPDIRNAEDDLRFAALCYRVVAEGVAQDLPLVGSIAGGRKTMSAHLMSAFTTMARPTDRLVHVLVSPPALERDPSFFHPTSARSGFVRLDRVDLRFPRLRHLMKEHFPGEAPPDPARLLNTLIPPQSPENRPSRIVCRLGNRAVGGCRVHLYGPDGGETARAALAPGEAATLLVLAEAVARTGGPVANTSLVNDPCVEARRGGVLQHAVRYAPPRPWETTDDVSKAVSALNRKLRQDPLTGYFLTIQSTPTREATYYGWPVALPPFEVETLLPGGGALPWPFRHVSRRPGPSRTETP